MPAITIKIGSREQLSPQISKATPLGALGTDAMVRVGQVLITGNAAALRALGEACDEAATMADSYDSDPAGYDRAAAAEMAADAENDRARREYEEREEGGGA
jgi:hypothetical protein